jgi:hypothetical protein
MNIKGVKRKAVLLITAVMFVFLASGTALSHPPKEVNLQWNDAGTLVVKVVHGVDDPIKHYVYRITVYVDNKVVETRDYKSQTDAGGMTDTFSIGSLRSETNLKAEAFCVIMGSATGSMVVP